MQAVFKPGERVDTPMGLGRVSSTIGTRVIIQLEGSRLPVEFAEAELLERNGREPIPRAERPAKPKRKPRETGRRPNVGEQAPKQPPATPAKCNDSNSDREKPKLETKAPVLDPALRALEALRFGLVPASMIDRLTIGFDEIEKWTKDRLPQGVDECATVSEVFGPFGSGKSHTMEAIRWIARREGYLTARIEVDGWTVTLSDPANFLNVLWPTLEGTDFRSETPLLDLYVKAMENGHRAPSVAPRGKDRIRVNYSTIRTLHRRDLVDKYGMDVEAVLSCSPDLTAAQLAGQLRCDPSLYRGDVRLVPIIGRSVEDRPYDFVEALVGIAIIAKMAGFKGLVVSIDEFEVEHLGGHWGRLEMVIEVLAEYLKGGLDHPDAPLALFIATVGQDGHAGDSALDPLLESGTKPFECKQLDKADLLELGKRLVRFYASAYGLKNLSEKDMDDILDRVSGRFYDNPSIWASSGLTRAWAKFLVQFLDKLMGPPHE